MSSVQYEFSEQQNSVISGLAGRMRGVGLFLIVVGVLNLILALLVVATIYRAKLPQDYVDKVLGAVEGQTNAKVKEQLDKLPPDQHLWGIAVSAGVNALLYLMIGVWTRSSAVSFQQIVDSRGNDINHLMNALGALNKMYTLIYTLIVIGLLLLAAMIGLAVYAQFAR